MLKRFVIVLATLFSLLALIFLIKGIEIYKKIQFFKNATPPPQTVAVAKAKTIHWIQTFPSVGTLAAINGVDVTSQVAGLVTQIHFESGQMVETGDVLVNLDTSVDEEQLANFRAQLALAEATYHRQSSLYQTQASARSALDQALADKKQAAANVAKEEQLIAQKTIRAPFSGKLGIRKVNLGQYINPGDAMVGLQSLNPLYVNFSLPEQDISYLKLGQKVGIRVDSYPGQEFMGRLTAISSMVDSQTRSISLQATIPNSSYELVPGSYAQVKVYRNDSVQVVVVPQTAITYRLYGDSVYRVVDTGKKDRAGKSIINAELNLVKVGSNIEDQVVIERGVKSGDVVVTAGQIKLQANTRIEPDFQVDMAPGTPTNAP